MPAKVKTVYHYSILHAIFFFHKVDFATFCIHNSVRALIREKPDVAIFRGPSFVNSQIKMSRWISNNYTTSTYNAFLEKLGVKR